MHRSKLNAYYQLTKPGVLYGNVLTGVAGFLFAARGQINLLLLVATIGGMTLVIAGACAINNYLDRDIDKLMKRTKQRPSVTGEIPPRHMLLFAILLAVAGFTVLELFTNWLVFLVGIVGYVTYVWLYGALSKRQSIHGTLVGSISGAMPVIGGYAAVAETTDAGFVVLFLILFFWQFPEFYSIAIYRKKEYAAAHVPVMSVIKGTKSTIRQIFIYTVLYVASTLSLTLLGYTGWIYFFIMLALGGRWIYLGWLGFKAVQPDRWARKMFGFSMITILVLCVMLSLGPLLP